MIKDVEVTKNENEMLLLSKWKGALMGFAALWIYFFHEHILLTSGEGVYWIEAFVKRIGFCGVDIFFLLSGMSLTYAIKKSNIWIFYLKRIKRVMVPMLIVGIVFGIIDKWEIQNIIKNIFGINFYIKNIYSFLWFIPAIMTFYLLFPFYYKLFLKSRNKLLFTLGVVELWLIVSLILRGTMRGDIYGFTNRIPIFIFGILFGWMCQNKDIKFSKLTWLFFCITLCSGLYLSYQSNYKGMEIIVPTSNCCLPNILMSISLSFLLAGLFEILSKIAVCGTIYKIIISFLNFYGMMSLEFYCVQEWIGRRYRDLFIGRYGNFATNILIFTITTLSGLFLYFVTKGIYAVIKIKEIWKRNSK